MTARFAPGATLMLDRIPRRSFDEFRRWFIDSVKSGRRILAYFGAPIDEARIEVVAVLGDAERSEFHVSRAIAAMRCESMTPFLPEAHLFERELWEDTGFTPDGHPWLKPVRFHGASRPGGARPQPSVTNFFRVAGEEIHEVAVGPVHAGIIEPGHFRFQCHGERVFHLEISLGYQHRAIERLFAVATPRRAIAMMETIAGDTTIGHALAHCEALESLAGVESPPRAQAIRAIALELERLANHTGDLGALANDVAFLPTASFCGRLRGDFLNMSALVCGSRFGRGLVRPGGCTFDIDDAIRRELETRLDAVERDVNGALELLFTTPSVVARFEETGEVAQEDARLAGLVGVAARASGLERDARFDFPTGAYRFRQIPTVSWPDGDVFGRAIVRRMEIQRSIEFIRQELKELPDGPIRVEIGALRPSRLSVGLIEGWRGEICHVALTDQKGAIERYKIVDPSFHNWFGLALALRDEQISDFPLCNKSFNLSYCGHDL